MTTSPIGFVAEVSSGVWLGRGATGPVRTDQAKRIRIFPTLTQAANGLAEAAHLCADDEPPLIYPVLVGRALSPPDVAAITDAQPLPAPVDIPPDLIGRLYRDPAGDVWRLEERADGYAIGADRIALILRRRGRLGRWGRSTENVGPDRLQELIEHDRITAYDGTVRFRRVVDEDQSGEAA